MNFHDVLEKIRIETTNTVELGDRFERLTQQFFLTTPLYHDLIENNLVWLWKDFPYKDTNDLGIDLVVKTKEDGYWAIQCKCFKDDGKINKEDIGKFVSMAVGGFYVDGKKEEFSQMFLVTTVPPTENANIIFNNAPIPNKTITSEFLDDSGVDWEKLYNNIYGKDAQLPKKNLRSHQSEALNNTNIHFQSNDRGKLIMACGTGKTFTALRIAENETDKKGIVLFLVPSIALLGQTLREWKSDTETNIHAICICSDPEISKKIGRNEEMDTDRIDELAYPASTDVDQVLQQFENIKKRSEEGMTVVFSTYQSIDVISKSQKKLMENGFPEFDLIICDEAHRTTGVTIAGKDESSLPKSIITIS
jgi:predicted helicase